MSPRGLQIQQVALIHVRSEGFSDRFGTGYALLPDVVITAWHVCYGSPGETFDAPLVVGVNFQIPHHRRIVAEIEWGDSALDVCLLRLDSPICPHVIPKWARLDRDINTAVKWESCGFPSASKLRLRPDEEAIRDTAHVQGEVLRLGAHISDHYELSVDGTTPTKERWHGLSGAAVFAEGYFLGITRGGPVPYAGGRLWVTPTARMLEAQQFRDILGEPNLHTVPLKKRTALRSLITRDFFILTLGAVFLALTNISSIHISDLDASTLCDGSNFRLAAVSFKYRKSDIALFVPDLELHVVSITGGGKRSLQSKHALDTPTADAPTRSFHLQLRSPLRRGFIEIRASSTGQILAEQEFVLSQCPITQP